MPSRRSSMKLVADLLSSSTSRMPSSKGFSRKGRLRSSTSSSLSNPFTLASKLSTLRHSRNPYQLEISTLRSSRRRPSRASRGRRRRSSPFEPKSTASRGSSRLVVRRWSTRRHLQFDPSRTSKLESLLLPLHPRFFPNLNGHHPHTPLQHHLLLLRPSLSLLLHLRRDPLLQPSCFIPPSRRKPPLLSPV